MLSTLDFRSMEHRLISAFLSQVEVEPFSSRTNVNNTVIRLNSIDKNSIYLGGSALFLHAKGCEIRDSYFSLNEGKNGACKIVTKFEDEIKKSNKAMMFNEEESSTMVFSVCFFDQEKKPINLVTIDNENEESNFEVKGCLFNGKLKKGSNFIDGKQHYNKKPKIFIESCSFGFDIKSAVVVEKVDSDKMFFVVHDGSTKFGLFNIIWVKIILITSFVGMFIVFFVWKINKARSFNNSLNDIID